MSGFNSAVRAESAEPATAPDPVPRVGVVLAAGRSQRLQAVTGGGSKALVHLGGVRLVERAVRMLLAAGVERVLVVVGYQAGAIATVLKNIEPSHVSATYAANWELGNGASLKAVEEPLGDERLFALVTTDHIFSEGALAELLRTGEPAVLTDFHPAPGAWAEGTRVRAKRGRALVFGKEIDAPAIDCGAFVLPSEIFESQRQAGLAGDHSLTGAVNRLAQTRPIRAVALPLGEWWQDIDIPEDLRLARRRLRRSLVKRDDGPVSRSLNRPVSTRLSMWLAASKVSPDLLSLLAFVAGLAGAWLIAIGEGTAGAILVHASSVLDGVDGEVARLTMRAGPRGALLDGILDRLADAAILGALALWALALGMPPHQVMVLAVAATAGALLSMASKDRIAALGLPRAPERLMGYLLGGRDSRLLISAIGALLGHPALALTGIAVTSMIALTVRVWLVRRVAALEEP